MPPADGVVLLDAIPGIAFDRLIALDGSVTDEHNLKVRNESLDMYSAANGYDPDGSSAYSQSFINRYLTAQAARQDGLVATAVKLRKQVASGTGQYSDDAPMPVGRDYAQLWQADSGLISHTKGKYPLISPQHPAGGPPQVVKSLRVPSASPAQNDSWADAGGAYTANTYMSITAIRAPKLRVTSDSITGVDWTSTNTATVDNVKGITTPLLIMSMTGHYFLVPAEMYYDSATHTTNKTLEFVEGATTASRRARPAPPPPASSATPSRRPSTPSPAGSTTTTADPDVPFATAVLTRDAVGGCLYAQAAAHGGYAPGPAVR